MSCRHFTKGWIVQTVSDASKFLTARIRVLQISILALLFSSMTLLSQGQNKGAYVAGINYPAGPATVPSNTYSLSGGISPQQIFPANFNGKSGVVVAASCEAGYMPTCPGNGAIVVYMSNGDGSFTPVTPPSGPSESIYSIVLGDFDNDGNLDVAAVTDCPPNSQNCSGVLLSVLYGDGNGNFTQQGVQYQINGAVATTRAANSLAVGDFNGDGNLDLVVGIECTGSNGCGTGGISIYPGTGDKTRTNAFGAPTSFSTTGNAPIIPVVGNFCGHSMQDIAAGSYGSLTILEAEGNGGFLELPPTPIGSSPMAMAAADVNGDGNLDLITTTAYAGFQILTGNGDCTFNSPVSYSTSLNNLGTNTTSLAIADLKGTGEKDLVIGAFLAGTNAIQMFFNDGQGNFTGGPTYGLGGWLYAPIVVQDFNGDGKVDVVMASACAETGADEGCPEGTLSVLLGNGNGTMQGATILNQNPTGSQSNCTITADVNGDGIPDLIQTVTELNSNNTTGQGGVIVSLGLGNGEYGPPSIPYPTGVGNSQWVAAADFRGIGKLDLAVANLSSDFGTDGGVAILLGNGDGTFQPPTVYDSGGSTALMLAVGDFNGDGKPDVAVMNQLTSIGILFGNGDGTLQPVVTTSTATDISVNESIAVFGTSVALLGQSTTPDGAGFYDGLVKVLRINGDGTLAQQGSSYPSGGRGNYSSVAVGNVTGKGNEIVVANPCELLDSSCSNGSIGVLTENLDGTFTSGPVQNVPDGRFYSIMLSDINDDGILDAIATNLTGVAVFFGNPDGSFQTPTVYAGVSTGNANVGLALSDLNIIQPGLSNGLTAVMVNKAGTYLVTTSSANPYTGNQSLQLTTTVSPSYLTGISPTGSISYYEGATLLGSTPIVNNTASYTPTGLSSGVHSIIASYSGDSNFAAHTGIPLLQVLTVPLQSTTTATSMISSVNPSTYGQSLTFTASVTSPAGVPTGTVIFYDSAISLGSVTLQSGQGTISLSTLAVGDHSITAQYSPSGNFQPSTSMAINEVVNLATTTTLVTSNAEPAVIGQSVTYIVAVSNPYGAPVGGSVTLTDGTKTLGTFTLSGGQANYTTFYAANGKHTIAATYSGDTNDQGSTGSWTQYIETIPVASTTKVSTSASPSIVTQSVTFTATVGSTYGSIPNGETVIFYDGTTEIGTGTTASGTATFSTSTLTVKTHTIKATYAGDATFKPSSGTVQQIVQAYATAIALSANPNPSNFGQAVVLTAVVTTAGSMTPTGKVTFYNGTTSLGTGTLDSTGTATLSTAKLPVGTDSLTATYDADSLNAKSTSSPVAETVNQAQITMAVTSSPNPSTAGKSVKFTATLSSNGSLPNAQTVTFSYNGSTLGTATISAKGGATFSTTTLPAGSDEVTATYAGSTDYSSATALVTQTVN